MISKHILWEKKLFLCMVKWFHLFLSSVNTQWNVKTVLFHIIQFIKSTQVNDETVLFQTIQFSKSTKLNGSKYYYVSLIIQLNTGNLYTHS